MFNKYFHFLLHFSLEYGILKYIPCQKYQLNEEEDGLHYISGIDGSLFQPMFEKFYTNKDFCVDFFYYSDPHVAEVEIKVTIVSLNKF